jgi:hypothetical protein
VIIKSQSNEKRHTSPLSRHHHHSARMESYAITY